MKTSKILYMATGLMLLSACSSDELDEYAGRIPINLGYEMLTVEDATRTAAATNLNDANIASGRGVKVRISEDNGTSYKNYDYTTNGGSSVMTPPDPKPYYPTSGNVKIVAYHPSTAGTTFTVKSDQTKETDYHDSDLMFSDNLSSVSKTTSAVNLQFTHKMAKLVVTANKGDGVSGIKTITLKNVKRQVTFDQTTGTVGEATATTGTDVIVFKEGSDNNASGTGAALIPAQTITGNLLEIETDQGTATYSVDSPGKTFNANTKYTITVTVNRTAVGVTNSITWGSTATATINPTVTQIVTRVPLANADVGMVICSDGYAYEPGSALPSGVTKCAMVAYVGDQNNATGNGAYSSTCNHGLAIALTDVINTSGDKQTSTSSTTLTWGNASTACSAYKGSRPSSASAWMLPSAYQWERMLIGCGSTATYVAYDSQSFPTSTNGFGYGNFRSKLTSCGTNAQGVYDVQSLHYWSSSEVSGDSSHAWGYRFNDSYFDGYSKTRTATMFALCSLFNALPLI